MSTDSAATAALYATHVLKDGDTFLVANGFGDIEDGSHGLFQDDTRLLSVYRLRLGATKPALLSAAVTSDNVFFVGHLTNRRLPPLGGQAAPKGLVHVCRSRFLWQERMYERISCMNYGRGPIVLPVRIELGADFRDVFEVRGEVRETRGELLPPVPQPAGVTLGYRGLDDLLRTAVVRFSRVPLQRVGCTLDFPLTLAAGGLDELFVEIASGAGDAAEAEPSSERYRTAAAQARRAMRKRQRRGARVASTGPLFDEWMDRSRADIALLTSVLPTGPYPYAGIPWFSTPFGRDAVITALQTLWLDPKLARGVLAFLAQHQAREVSSFKDAAPGKIMHETRHGEMAALGEVPFAWYFGGVDTTPLFVVLAGAYARRTGDHGFIDALWPALLAAIGWIERTCDGNPLGLLDYARGKKSGLSNQGWKDSEDSVFHADGRFPKGPIALVEVQGYAFAAFRAMADLASQRGNDGAAVARWRSRAERLRQTVEERFWMPAHNYYGIAIDGEGALCEVRSSNPGHLLYVGMIEPSRAARVAQTLMTADFHSGWGLRTLARGEPHYNPMSYHNGSVWPHDSALCVAGIARYGDRVSAVRLLDDAFAAAVHFDMRLPELFCGFPRAQRSPPIAYPVACLPQAWAAGSPFMLLQACLGVEIDGWRGQINVDHPWLPLGIDRVRLSQLDIGDKRVDLVFRRIGDRIDDRIGVFIEGADADAVALKLRN